MTRTTQKTRKEKAEERINMEKAIIKDSLLLWHYLTVKDELKEEVKEGAF